MDMILRNHKYEVLGRFYYAGKGDAEQTKRIEWKQGHSSEDTGVIQVV